VPCDAGSSLAGCCSSGRWSGIIISLVMALTLLLLTRIFHYLPKFVLAAIVITSVFPLVAFTEGLSIVVAMYESARPHLVILWRIPGTSMYAT